MRNEKFPNTVKFESAFVILCIKKNPLRVIGKYMLPDEFVYGVVYLQRFRMPGFAFSTATVTPLA